ncbi:MAG: hypothetical protein RIS76_1162 [Verrucomicrobiota bacterium]
MRGVGPFGNGGWLFKVAGALLVPRHGRTEIVDGRSPAGVLGTRALDGLNVACALELKHRRFLTFDGRQQRLAAAAGLKLIHF